MIRILASLSQRFHLFFVRLLSQQDIFFHHAPRLLLLSGKRSSDSKRHRRHILGLFPPTLPFLHRYTSVRISSGSDCPRRSPPPSPLRHEPSPRIFPE